MLLRCHAVQCGRAWRAGQAEGRAALAAAVAAQAEADARLAGAEDRVDVLEAENAQLESMKVRA